MPSYRWHQRPLVVGERILLWSELSRAIYRKDKRITIATNLEWGVRTFQLNHANLECLKQMPQKPGDLKREDFQNMCQIKPKKQIIFVVIFFTSIGQWVAKLGCHKAFPQNLANLWFMGIRIELDSVIFSDSLCRVVTKISSCRVNTTSRRWIKRLGISFGSIFFLFFNKSSRGPLS